jgi:hypothetical protein
MAQLSPRHIQMRGHPTAPGLRDPYVARMGEEEFADGQPGVPRVQPTPESQAFGVPWQTNGPMQVNTKYDGPHDF